MRRPLCPHGLATMRLVVQWAVSLKQHTKPPGPSVCACGYCVSAHFVRRELTLCVQPLVLAETWAQLRQAVGKTSPKLPMISLKLVSCRAAPAALGKQVKCFTLSTSSAASAGASSSAMAASTGAGDGDGAKDAHQLCRHLREGTALQLEPANMFDLCMDRDLPAFSAVALVARARSSGTVEVLCTVPAAWERVCSTVARWEFTELGVLSMQGRMFDACSDVPGTPPDPLRGMLLASTKPLLWRHAVSSRFTPNLPGAVFGLGCIVF